VSSLPDLAEKLEHSGVPVDDLPKDVGLGTKARSRRQHDWMESMLTTW
jgi:hypothetical protein